MKSSSSKAALFAAILCMSLTAGAQSVYFGGGIGRANVGFDLSDFTLNTAGINEESDSRTSAWKAFVGYDFTKHVGIEGGHVRFGTVAYRYLDGGLGYSGRVEQKNSAWYLALKGSLPLSDQFSLIGKLGSSRNSTKMNERDSLFVVSSDSHRRSQVIYGAGAEYALSPRFMLRVEYEHFGKFGRSMNPNEVALSGTGRARLELWSASVVARF